MSYSTTAYLSRMFNSKHRKETVKRIVKELRKIQNEFDFIAISGVSGGIVGPIVADKLNKDLTIIRKGEKAHTTKRLEGRVGGRYIILDDLIETGETICRIYDTVLQHTLLSESSELVGIMLYNSTDKTEDYEDRNTLPVEGVRILTISQKGL